ncbi:GNAT family N-acetyltransferase [Actinomadura sp. WMMB 499]|uniref:GNAT family N-acetyltransferase n=1 Tax=Actinomadura sp. WMMB 499 TaxID=1219491 RepID=UPI001245259A|nr:GNAT family N-acetyltransferase [Actinomadura sp. WMMB 499]QFG24234.1 GNAT family N-acetyltransferase [Actinomadura sp. WMMB 499]
MPVRPAEPDDFEAICAMLLAHAAHEGAGDQMRLHREETYAALFGAAPVVRAHIASPPDAPGTTAGFALWYPTFSSWATKPGIWLEDLYIEPEHRRHGLGRELLDTLRSLTDGRVEWDVADGNDAAQDFYRSLGALPVGGWIRYRWSAR